MPFIKNNEEAQRAADKTFSILRYMSGPQRLSELPYRKKLNPMYKILSEFIGKRMEEFFSQDLIGDPELRQMYVREKMWFKIYYHVRSNNIEFEVIAEGLGLTVDRVKEMMEKKEDCSLSTLIKLEQILGINLLNIQINS